MNLGWPSGPMPVPPKTLRSGSGPESPRAGRRWWVPWEDRRMEAEEECGVGGGGGVGEKVKIGKRERREEEGEWTRRRRGTNKMEIGKRERREEGEWTRRRRGTDAKKNGCEHI
ncbi:hypothetical protein AAZX31_15G214300 [Glycine max]